MEWCFWSVKCYVKFIPTIAVYILKEYTTYNDINLHHKQLITLCLISLNTKYQDIYSNLLLIKLLILPNV